MVTGEVLTGGMRAPTSTGGTSSGVAGVTLRAKVSSTSAICALSRGGVRLTVERGAAVDVGAASEEREAAEVGAISEGGGAAAEEGVASEGAGTPAEAETTSAESIAASGCSKCATVRRASTIFTQVTDGAP